MSGEAIDSRLRQKANDAVLFDLLSQWVLDDATRHRILVESPQALYGFAKSS